MIHARAEAVKNIKSAAERMNPKHKVGKAKALTVW